MNHVLLTCKSQTENEYQDLKRRKKVLIESGEYNSENREKIIRKFGALLSYPEEKIKSLLKK